MRSTLFAVAAPWVALAALALPAAAYWEVPEGQPYKAEERVLFTVSASVVVDGLTHKDGVVAWTEAAQRGPGALKVYDDRDTGAGAPGLVQALPNSSAATGPVLGGGHVAWLEVEHADFPVQRAIYAVNLSEGVHEVVRLDGGEGLLSGPHMDGATLAWSAYTSVLDAGNATLHRIDLQTGFAESWASPLKCSTGAAWPVGARLLILGALACDGDQTESGLYLFDPATGAAPRIASGNGGLHSVDQGRVVWTEYREGDGRGTSIYLYDTLLGLERRVTWSEGRECCSSLSGDLLTWMDLRSERTRDPVYDIYFEDLLTSNEYKLEGSRSLRAGPALDGRDLAYLDAQGRMILARLPGPAELLTVTAVAEVDADGAHVRLNASVAVDVAWDLDGDGTFEQEGTVNVTLHGGLLPDLNVSARAVDGASRVAVLNVRVASLELRQVAPLPLTPVPPPGPDGRDAKGHGEPIPGPGMATLAGLLAPLAFLARRRNDAH